MTVFVSVAAIGHRVLTLPRFALPSDRKTPLHVLTILVGRGIRAETVDNHVNTSILGHLIDEPDFVILRVHPSQADRVLRTLETTIGLLQRFEGRAVGVLSLNDNRHPTVAWASGISPAAGTPPTAIDGIDVPALAMAAELLMYVERPSVLLPSSSEFHYEGPNGSHYQAYIRAQFAFASRDSIDGLAFWLAQHLPDGCAVLVDSPGFLAVGLAVAEYFRREFDCPPQDVPTVESRDFYGEAPEIIASRLQVDASFDRPVVLLSSIVSSGRSLEAMQEACRAAGFADLRSVSVFSARGCASPDLSLQHLDVDLTPQPADECEACLQERKPVVRIRKSSGLVEVSALVAQARITGGAGARSRDFFSRYSAYPEAVSVHVDQHDSRRHHVIDVSVAVLVEAPQFRERVVEALAPVRGRRVVVVHPEHDDARALADVVRTAVAAEVIPCEPSQLGSLTSDEAAAVRAADVILLVDDVAITGSRLRQYRAFLNAYHLVDASGSPAVVPFVGLLRPSSSHRRTAIADMADRPYGLLHAEELLLPDWRGPDCPWCNELRLLESIRLPLDSLIAKRREQLRRGALTDGLFLPFHDNRHPGSDGLLLGSEHEEAERNGADAMELGPRSVFGELTTESQVFVAVSSALQHMRDVDPAVDANALSDTFTSPISRVLQPDYYLSGRFYAPVILCSILRAARRFDVRAAAIEPQLRREAGERFVDVDRIRPEMLYAMARGILPRPSEVGDKELLRGMDSSVRGFLTGLSSATL